MTTYRTLLTSSILLALAVLIGAFSAHGLEKNLSATAIQTFETGVRYHFYHGLGLFLIGVLQILHPKIELKVPAFLITLGIVLFSFNCYIYAVSGVKIFAMIVPIGGVSFILAWVILAFKLKGLIK